MEQNKSASAARFQAALEAVIARERAQNGIGTLGEKTLHAALKRYLEPREEYTEAAVAGYVADIVREDGIMEIQTGQFNRLRKKLPVFLKETDVTVVYPIPQIKYIRWMDPETGVITPPRKSPKTGTVWDVFPELYKIRDSLYHPRLHLRLMLFEMTEYRCLNGWSRDRKKGSSRCDRVPSALLSDVTVNAPSDWLLLLPTGLPSPFTVRQFAAFAHSRLPAAQTACMLLFEAGVLCRIGKKGNAYLYAVKDDADAISRAQSLCSMALKTI